MDLPEAMLIWWDGEKDGKEFWKHREKGFIVEKKGFLKDDEKERGDLLVRINLVSMNPENGEGVKEEKGMIEPKWVLDEKWRERYERSEI